jgi:two-component system NtrC family response regulator
MVMCQGDSIKVSDLPKEFKNNVYNTLYLDGIPASAKLDETLAMIEKKMIERALKLTDNVQSKAAELLGIGKSGLNWKMKKFKLDAGSKQ